MGESYLFIGLLALTIATVGAVLVQVVFGFIEVKKRRLQERLGAAQDHYESAYGPIASAEEGADLPTMLRHSTAVKNFHRKLGRAFPNVLLGRFLFLIAVLAGAAFLGGFIGMRSVAAGALLAIVACILPFMIVSSRVAKHQKTVEDQLPEALDFLARVLRAGHSLATGLQMAADELPHPLAWEFRRCYDQHSLGHPLDVAMREMANRVGTADFSFFVTAVLIQRTTGGDLAEVLTNIGNMVRSRIRLQQHVKAITAEGRLVGYILLVLPILFFFILYFLNPRYAGVLLNTREGLYVLSGAVVLQMLGLFTIRRIVSVKM
jgi:tight adherence protein B